LGNARIDADKEFGWALGMDGQGAGKTQREGEGKLMHFCSPVVCCGVPDGRMPSGGHCMTA
jgi:hypothetical protein